MTLRTPGGGNSSGSIIAPLPRLAAPKCESEEESSSEGSSLRTSGSSIPPLVSSVASSADVTGAGSPPVLAGQAGGAVPEPRKSNSFTRSRKTGSGTTGSSSSGSRRKSRTLKREQEDDAAAAAAAPATAAASGSGSRSGSISADDSTDVVFGKVFDQLRAAQAALQAREERLKLREGRLRAKKRSLLKRQAAHGEKTEATRAELDQRERALEVREAACEARMKRLTRLQKEEHMRNLIASFTDAQVVLLQRALRSWMCRRARWPRPVAWCSPPSPLRTRAAATPLSARFSRARWRTWRAWSKCHSTAA